MANPEQNRDIGITDAYQELTQPVQNRWAFLVGINDYREHQQFPSLNYCVSDVLALQTLLEQVGYTVVCLHDQLPFKDPRYPTAQNIEAEFKGLCESVDPKDLLLVYFACHGTRQGDGTPRLIAEDTRSNTLEKTAIEVATLEAWMRQSEAERLILMLDACHMGIGTDKRNLADPDFIHDVYDLATGFAFMAASTDQQTARELGTLKHGLMSYHVLTGLAGAAKLPELNIVTVNSLQQYVLHELKKQAVAAGFQQKPQQRAEGDLGDMILVDYRQEPLPDTALVTSSDPDKDAKTGVAQVSRQQASHQQQQVSPAQTLSSPITNAVNTVKLRSKKRVLDIRIKEYEAATDQLITTLDNAAKVILNEKLSQLESEINQLTSEIKELEASGEPS